MLIEVDLSTVPPAVVLKDADNMKAFSVTVVQASETFVDRDVLLRMAGDLAGDSEWLAGFEAMVAYAQSKGWVRESDGAIQAHIE